MQKFYVFRFYVEIFFLLKEMVGEGGGGWGLRTWIGNFSMLMSSNVDTAYVEDAIFPFRGKIGGVEIIVIFGRIFN